MPLLDIVLLSSEMYSSISDLTDSFDFLSYVRVNISLIQYMKHVSIIFHSCTVSVSIKLITIYLFSLHISYYLPCNITQKFSVVANMFSAKFVVRVLAARRR